MQIISLLGYDLFPPLQLIIHIGKKYHCITKCSVSLQHRGCTVAQAISRRLLLMDTTTFNNLSLVHVGSLGGIRGTARGTACSTQIN
jgi:hypothetical protein